MPVFELGYRRFDGELSRKNRVLAIAWESVVVRVKWWTWLLLFVAWFMPHLIYAVMLAVNTVLAPLMGAVAQLGGTAPTVAFQGGGLRGMGMLMSGLSGDSTYLFWDALQNSSMWNAVVPAVVCAGILASDRRTGALQIYFARPVTRRDYLLAKILATAVFSLAVTGVPTLLLWIEACLFHPDSSYFIGTWYAPFSILGASAIYALWTTSIVLALSSVFKRPVFVGIAALVLYLLSTAVSKILVRELDAFEWHLLQQDYLLGLLTAPFFGLDLPDELTHRWLLLIGLVLPALLLALAWSRIRAVEVQT